MAENKLSPNEIEYLSWMLMARGLEFIDLDLNLADLHPGGGQYDCLSLISNDFMYMPNFTSRGFANSPVNEDITMHIHRNFIIFCPDLSIFISRQLGIFLHKGRNKSIDIYICIVK